MKLPQMNKQIATNHIDATISPHLVQSIRYGIDPVNNSLLGIHRDGCGKSYVVQPGLGGSFWWIDGRTGMDGAIESTQLWPVDSAAGGNISNGVYYFLVEFR